MTRKQFTSWFTSRVAEPKMECGVFRWNAENQYPRENAIRVFKRESSAQKYCDRENALHPEWGRTALVVRDVYPE